MTPQRAPEGAYDYANDDSHRSVEQRTVQFPLPDSSRPSMDGKN